MLKLYRNLSNIVMQAMTTMLAAIMLAYPAMSWANNLSLTQIPLNLGGNTEPNVMFTIDDSGSMGWEVMPDSLTSINRTSFPTSNSWGGSRVYNTYYDPTSSSVTQIRSSDINTIYYNPAIRYVPWSKADATTMANADPACAHYDPMNPNTATCVNFTVQASVTERVSSKSYVTHNVWPADYYIYNGGGQTTASNYTHVVIDPAVTTYTGSTARTDCANAPTCTYAEEVQNFANWFQYYRERMMTAKAGISRAFALQPEGMRVGYGSINTSSHTVDGVSTRTVIDGVRHFSGASRTAFFTRLYNQTTNGSTPLRQALEGVGNYYKRTDNAGPWGNTPGDNTDNTPHSTCRQSYNILMTDGYYNGSTPSVSSNVDGSNGPTITAPSGTTYQYTPTIPYQDTYSATLADVAMYFWNHDLRTDLANSVPSNTKDPAFWQHMVNFTVGLGVNGTLTYPTDLPSSTNGIVWPSGQSHQIDDLWHAAVNSRGGYYSARNPDEFATALSSAFSDILGRTSSGSPLAISSTAISSSNVIFRPSYESGNWTGDIRAYPINLTTGALGAQVWDAQTQVTAQNWDTGRNIVTYIPGTGSGVPFRWASLSGQQKTDLNKNPTTGTNDNQGSARLDFLRGRALAAFRSRPVGLLGDIVDSGPVYVGAPGLRYPDNWGSGAAENAAPYSSYKTAQASRAARIYVGANDGMLHALDAATGNEVFAFVPSVLFPKLNRLTETTYNLSHRYYVDGDVTVSDVFFSSDSSWHTVLVGSLRGGGQGIFALDITDPTATNETTAAAKVLWEFTDSDDADLGYTYGKPQITRMHNGQWAAIVGNGYNNMEADGKASTTGDSVVYVLDIETGSVIKKFDTGNGVAQSTHVPQLTNGMATPTVVDVNQDSIADYIYAGDLQGNVWKFDVTGTAATSWKSSYLTGTSPMPLFKATDSSGAAQPITSAVDVTRHPSYPGYMVYFGTGKYLELSDNIATAQPTQTLYGVWDRTGGGLTQPTTSVLRSHLLQQQILQEVTVSTSQARVISNNPINWHSGTGLPTGNPPTSHMGWYMDLVNTGVTPLNNKGERVLSGPYVLGGQVFFTTFLSSSDPCSYGGGDSWIMALDASTGGRLASSAFDLNGTGGATSADFVTTTINGQTVTVPASGVKSKSGAIAAFVVVQTATSSGTGTGASLLYQGSDVNKNPEIKDINPGKPVAGRQSWIRLR